MNLRRIFQFSAFPRVSGRDLFVIGRSIVCITKRRGGGTSTSSPFRLSFAHYRPHRLCLALLAQLREAVVASRIEEGTLGVSISRPSSYLHPGPITVPPAHRLSVPVLRLVETRALSEGGKLR